MIGNVLEALRHVFFWPGDTFIGWLLTHHPQLAAWLDVSPASYGGLTSALISGLVGWGLFGGLCQLLLLVVQLRETLAAPRHEGKESVARKPE